MTFLAAVVLASVSVKWDLIGPSGPNPAEVRTGPGMVHAIRQEIDRPNSQSRYIVNDTVLPWRPIGNMQFVNTTDDGKAWYYTFTEGLDRVMWVNGKEVARGFSTALAVTDKIFTISKDGRTWLEEGGKRKLEGKELHAWMTKSGLMTSRQTDSGTWETKHGKWTITSTDQPTPFILKDNRVLVRAGGKAYIDGIQVEGLPTIDNDDDLLLTPSERSWYLSKGGKRFWINGKEVKVTLSGLEICEDIPFERAILMQKDASRDDEISGYDLFLARPEKPTLAIENLFVQEVISYAEGAEAGYALLVDLPDDEYAIIRDGGKVVWKAKDKYPDTTEYCGLAMSPKGDRLAFVTESLLGETVHVNDQTFGPYKSVDYMEETAVIFSPDGKRFAYVAEAKSGDPMCLYVDGEPTEITYDRAVKYGDPVWETNSRMKMMVGKGGKVFRVTLNL